MEPILLPFGMGVNENPRRSHFTDQKRLQKAEGTTHRCLVGERPIESTPSFRATAPWLPHHPAAPDKTPVAPP